MCGHRVDEYAVLLEAVVEVRSGRESGRAYSTDELALTDARAGADGNRGQMQVFSLEPVGVPKVDHASGASAHPRGHHDAVRDGHDRRSGRRAVIHPKMRADLTQNWMH